MISIKAFTFNLYQENSYILFDETKECVIIDPGCYSPEEKNELVDFISSNNLKPVLLVNTHCHIDHILGNAYVSRKYDLELHANLLDDPNRISAVPYSEAMGLKMTPSPEIKHELNEGDEIKFGNSKLDVLFTPGHSAGSVSFYSAADSFIIAGDVLFNRSVGRVDLPGGDAETLIKTIKEKLFILPAETEVYSGHGPKTSIGNEIKHNPYVGEAAQHTL